MRRQGPMNAGNALPQELWSHTGQNWDTTRPLQRAQGRGSHWGGLFRSSVSV